MHEQPNEIPTGFCQCGCGQRTLIAERNIPSLGWVKGSPKRFLVGHHAPTPDYTIDERGCWVWLKSRTSKGYGMKVRGGRLYRAHRWYYEQAKGGVPNGLELDHLCRNSACVNPDHLEAVTRKVNNNRGRSTKLTDEQVRQIRRSGEPNTVIAVEYGIHPGYVSALRCGRDRRFA